MKTIVIALIVIVALAYFGREFPQKLWIVLARLTGGQRLYLLILSIVLLIITIFLVKGLGM